jgi:hypothetical protein
MLIRGYAVVTLAGPAIGLPSAFTTALPLDDVRDWGRRSAYVRGRVGLMLALGPVATVIPTRRAAALDPVAALRADGPAPGSSPTAWTLMRQFELEARGSITWKKPYTCLRDVSVRFCRKSAFR